jgi:hypothetical protein
MVSIVARFAVSDDVNDARSIRRSGNRADEQHT